MAGREQGPRGRLAPEWLGCARSPGKGASAGSALGPPPAPPRPPAAGARSPSQEGFEGGGSAAGRALGLSAECLQRGRGGRGARLGCRSPSLVGVLAESPLLGACVGVPCLSAAPC